MRRVILTGGAGYIGKCVAWKLRQQGVEPLLLDNFSTSRREGSQEFDVREVDLADISATRQAFRDAGKVDAVIHLAAHALVPESVREPGLYFRNNLAATINTAEAAVECGIGIFLHSSSCAVYGIPEQLPLTETSLGEPASPYGETKRMAERVLQWIGSLRDLSVLNLRYFNPAGAIQGRLGENHVPETHLIPNVVQAGLTGGGIDIFGDDYPTPDGTCVRDFIHVEDLAEAHWLGLGYLARETTPMRAINVGAGRGVSVRQVVEAAERVMAKPIETRVSPRRPGDPPSLVADISTARRVLGWEPSRTLDEMIASHWQFIRGPSRENRGPQVK